MVQSDGLEEEEEEILAWVRSAELSRRSIGCSLVAAAALQFFSAGLLPTRRSVSCSVLLLLLFDMDRLFPLHFIGHHQPCAGRAGGGDRAGRRRCRRRTGTD